MLGVGEVRMFRTMHRAARCRASASTVRDAHAPAAARAAEARRASPHCAARALHRFHVGARSANPERFLALLPDARAAVLGGDRAALLAVGLYLGLVRAGRLPAGRDGPDHVHPRAGRLALHGLLRAAWRSPALGTLVWRHPLADVAAEGGRAARRRLHLHLPRHRLALGQADVGRLLGVGRAADLGPRAVPHVSRPHRAVARHRGSEPRRAAPPRS